MEDELRHTLQAFLPKPCCVLALGLQRFRVQGLGWQLGAKLIRMLDNPKDPAQKQQCMRNTKHVPEESRFQTLLAG